MSADRLVIAIDGPSGSGKSSASRGVAKALGLAYLDTGAMYRAVACAFLDAGVDPSDQAGVIAATLGADLEISTDPDDQWVRVNGRDVTTAIREPEVSSKVSAVSTLAECRANLVARQRAIIESAAGGIVAEGRDITTVVAPDADVRLLLTADPAIRMARRQLELGDKVDAAQLADQVLRRDSDDSTLVNFTTAADGVTHLDGTYLTLEETIQAVLDLVAKGRV
ncbi:MAG TPA: (d)CMP kinase [Propionicimonas sp.]|jgi:cytidylate kinase|uniref:(d)CMP kinase n=1 Tax=Propionicimonas sp. TaxID=1955623 RepID=UPI002F4255A3